VAIGGHTCFESRVLAVPLRPGSIPASSAPGRRAGMGRTSSATRMAPSGRVRFLRLPPTASLVRSGGRGGRRWPHPFGRRNARSAPEAGFDSHFLRALRRRILLIRHRRSRGIYLPCSAIASGNSRRPSLVSPGSASNGAPRPNGKNDRLGLESVGHPRQRCAMCSGAGDDRREQLSPHLDG